MIKVPLGFVYCLQNPTTSEVFYVGATQVSIKNRLRTHYQHLSEAEKGKRKMNKRYDYLNKLKPLKATIILLEVVVDGDLDEREKFFINHYRGINNQLTNMTDGGAGGCTFKYYTLEERQKYGHSISKTLKGRKKPKGFAENMSIKRRGLRNPGAKEMKIGWVVANNEVLFKHGFEVDAYTNSPHGYGNILSHFKKQRIGTPYNTKWTLYKNLDKKVQNKVREAYDINKRKQKI